MERGEQRIRAILSILFPITAFVALGFEPSIANMYFIPMGLRLESEPTVLAAAGLDPAALGALSWAGFARNLVPVTIGNVVGGSLLVGAMYWFIYLRGGQRQGTPVRRRGRSSDGGQP